MLSAPPTTLVATAESLPSLPAPTPPHAAIVIASPKAKVEPNTLRIIRPPRLVAVASATLQGHDQREDGAQRGFAVGDARGC
jgi:hypothetical protein